MPMLKVTTEPAGLCHGRAAKTSVSREVNDFTFGQKGQKGQNAGSAVQNRYKFSNNTLRKRTPLVPPVNY
jgi:hypothetical protein